MEQYPKISIVTPCFNSERFLERTIVSVTDQGYPNLEYIVVDGGSTDRSVEIIKKYQDKITWWISEKDQGMYHAIQKGFLRSTGSIMGWINSDDILHRGSLFTIGQLFRDYQQISWIQGAPNILDEQGRVVNIFSWPEISKLYFYKKNRDVRKYIQQESTFWRRSLWEKAGGHVSTKFRYAGDFELWMRYFQIEPLYHVSAMLGSFRVSKSGQASVENFQAYVDETNTILKLFPISSEEKRKLVRSYIIERVEHTLMQALRLLKKRFKIMDHSAVYNGIYFDRHSQLFHIKEKEN